jgi:hypothetical protein
MVVVILVLEEVQLMDICPGKPGSDHWLLILPKMVGKSPNFIQLLGVKWILPEAIKITILKKYSFT